MASSSRSPPLGLQVDTGSGHHGEAAHHANLLSNGLLVSGVDQIHEHNIDERHIDTRHKHSHPNTSASENEKKSVTSKSSADSIEAALDKSSGY